MKHRSMLTDFSARCAQALEAAWPGIKVLDFDVEIGVDGAGAENIGETVRVHLSVSGPEAALIERGLITPESASKIPPCGACYRGGWQISRGKKRTRLRSWELASPASEFDMLGLIAPILVPALVYRPPQRARSSR